MRMNVTRITAVLLAIGLVASTTDVRAQGGPIDIQQFKPAMDSKGHFTVDSTQVLGPWNTSIGLLVNYAYRPLELTGENGRWFRVNDLVGANIQFALGMFKLSKKSKPWLEIGIGLPILFHNSQLNNGSFAWANGQGGCTTQYGCTVWAQDPAQKEKYPLNYDADGRATAQGLGDMYLHFKFRFMDAFTNPVGIGAMLSLYFPTSKVGAGNQRMLGYGGVGLAPKFILDRVWKKKGMLLSVNFGARLRFGSEAELRENRGWFGCQRTDINGGTVLPATTPCGPAAENYGFEDKAPDNGLTERVSWLYEITYGVGFSWTLAKQVVWTSELIGAIELSSLGKSNSDINTENANSFLGATYGVKYAKRVFPVELLTGFKFYLATSSFFAIGAGVGLTGVGPLNNIGSPDARVFASFVFEPTVGDRDGDGIPDDVDKCPDDPEDFDDFEDKDGCPDPDNDGDGIPDVDDKCPNDPETYNGFEDEDGCPDKKDEDRDGDGIPDSVDKCPDEPEDKDGFEDQDGCPDPDNDGDGVADKDDKCPGFDADKKDSFGKTKEDQDGFEDEDGCPDFDNDKDGILDKDDKCPNEPETVNGYKDDDGCPDKNPITITKDKVLIMEKIYFETDKDIIKPISYPILDTVASTLVKATELKQLEIQGHTDERGSQKYNLDLSGRRAAAVRQYLINKGVGAARLTARGYGEDRPKCKASTEECWSQNRRVEFIIIKRE